MVEKWCIVTGRAAAYTSAMPHSLSPDLTAVLHELGFSTLTPIQAASIPALLEGRDLIGQSKTGSGKTAAFTLPILQNLAVDARSVQALVVCPTRELVAQVAREARRLGRKIPGLQVLDVGGGQAFRPQAEALARGAHVVVGTPGRLLDHLRRETLDLRGLRTLVLDEADRMLDMGFAEDVLQIIAASPTTRQTVLFSATFPPAIEHLSRRVQRKPVNVRIEDDAERVEIRQEVYPVTAEDKLNVLVRVLRSHPGSTLIFCNQKATIASVVARLDAERLAAAALHGDLEQRERDQVLAMFRGGSVRRLVATDVAGRGLDIDHLDLVVNYDLPFDADTFVHRIGRTGRAGRPGRAISLGTDHDRERLREIAAAKGFKIELREAGRLRAAPATAVDNVMRTLFISGGRKDKLRPGDILGALTGAAGGLEAAAVGKIEIHDRISYVAVADRLAEAAAARLRAGKIKGKRFVVGIPKD